MFPRFDRPMSLLFVSFYYTFDPGLNLKKGLVCKNPYSYRLFFPEETDVLFELLRGKSFFLVYQILYQNHFTMSSKVPRIATVEIHRPQVCVLFRSLSHSVRIRCSRPPPRSSDFLFRGLGKRPFLGRLVIPTPLIRHLL